ncbi:hypothetical protein RKD19_008145 [Streptomyces canus]
MRQLYAEAVGNARVGVLDTGKGIGRVTVLGLAGSDAGVHAHELVPSIRTSLHTVHPLSAPSTAGVRRCRPTPAVSGAVSTPGCGT